MATPTPFTMLLVGLALLAAAWLYSLTRTYLRLRHIPGPILASLTDLWNASRIWQGAHHYEIMEALHQKYGPVVRFAPSRVSFADPNTIPQIYGMNRVFPKASSYGPLNVLAHGKEVMSLVTMSDEKKVTGVKRHISSGFSQSTWMKQEYQIDRTLQIFIDQLTATVGQEIPLEQWLSFWSFDTITDLAFSDRRGYITAGRDIDDLFPSARQRFAHWKFWASMPGLEALIYKNWFTAHIQKATAPLAQLAMRRIQQRKAEGKSDGGGGNDLLARYLAASEKAPDSVAPAEVLSLTVSTISAGSETTAMTSSIVLGYLLQNPSTLARLEQEILNAGLSFPPKYAEVEHLPYLDSAVHEGMRLMINPNCLERVITAPGAEIGGVLLPAGTNVSTAEICVSRDPKVYGAEPHEFRPERWLGVEKAKWAEMDRSSLGFSFGRRECIGKHLARMEMKKVLASLVLRFKITPLQPVKMWCGSGLPQIRLNVGLQQRL